ncbi:MAG: hypothetical protein JXA03_06465 [Bacteroidales bacterium]|nr:hypothetical protein [Bacteroidales bacterium]
MNNKYFQAVFIFILWVCFSLTGFAQPLPFDGSIGGGEGILPVGGGASLGNGLMMLVTMGVGYGIYKYKSGRKKLME